MTTTPPSLTQVKDKHPTPQTKFTIRATLDGFPIAPKGEGRAATYASSLSV